MAVCGASTKLVESFRRPMIAAGLLAIPVHPLLHNDPVAIVGDDEAVQIKIETVLDSRAIDFRDKAARLRQGLAVEADAVADRYEFARSLTGMLAAPAADMDAKLAREWRETVLQRADHARGDAGGMPIHAHHGTERLEPEGMAETAEELIPAIVEDDGLGHNRAEPRHAAGQPLRNAAAMQR